MYPRRYYCDLCPVQQSNGITQGCFSQSKKKDFLCWSTMVPDKVPLKDKFLAYLSRINSWLRACSLYLIHTMCPLSTYFQFQQLSFVIGYIWMDPKTTHNLSCTYIKSSTYHLKLLTMYSQLEYSLNLTIHQAFKRRRQYITYTMKEYNEKILVKIFTEL